MKTKLALIVALAILVAGLVGCSQDADQGNTGILSAVYVGYDGNQECVTLWAGQNIDAGTVCVGVNYIDGAEHICITYNTIDGWELVETHVWAGNDIGAMPQTKKGNPKIGNFPYHSGDITGATTWEVCIPLSEWGTELSDGSATDLCGMIMYVAAHASLQKPDGGGGYQTETGWADGGTNGLSWATYFSVELTCDDSVPPTLDGCETVYAYGCLADAHCFSEVAELEDDFDPKPARWGWTNGPLAAGTYYFDIYAGAGLCDLSKGTLVGMLTVVYDGLDATVTYFTYEGFEMEEVHLYVGTEILPRLDGDYTIANGHLGHTMEFDTPVSEYSHTVGDLSGEIYVVAHAVVCGDYETAPSYEPVCDQPCDEWILYGSNLNPGTEPLDDALYAYDLKNQTQTLVYDPTSIDSSQNYPNANAYDAVNQRIYFGTDDGRLFYHEIGSGTHVQVEGGTTSGTFGTMACGSFYDGKFYYVQNGTNRLYAVDIVANVATRTEVGTVPVSVGYGDIAFDPANPGQFIGSGSGIWYWYDLNDNSSAIMTESGGDGAHKQLAYGSDGVLYGVNAVDGQFYTIVYDGVTVTLTLDWDSPYTYTDLASGPQCQ